MSTVLQFPGRRSGMPVDALLATIPSLPRAVLARLTERMIDRMDEIDGDADVELNGDELDGSDRGEDEFWPHWLNHGFQPGCPISDPGEDTYDEEDDRNAW